MTTLEAANSFYDNVADVLLDGAPMVVTPESAVEVARILEWGQLGFDPAHLNDQHLAVPATLN